MFAHSNLKFTNYIKNLLWKYIFFSHKRSNRYIDVVSDHLFAIFVDFSVDSKWQMQKTNRFTKTPQKIYKSEIRFKLIWNIEISRAKEKQTTLYTAWTLYSFDVCAIPFRIKFSAFTASSTNFRFELYKSKHCPAHGLWA